MEKVIFQLTRAGNSGMGNLLTGRAVPACGLRVFAARLYISLF
jgi:hypothetical protein